MTLPTMMSKSGTQSPPGQRRRDSALAIGEVGDSDSLACFFKTIHIHLSATVSFPLKVILPLLQSRCNIITEDNNLKRMLKGNSAR